MEHEQQQVIGFCQEFASKADELETKAFLDPNYKSSGFIADFKLLFDQYAFGKQNRTVSGLNFRQPPRYSYMKNATEIEARKINKSKYEVTFWGAKAFHAIKFIVQYKAEGWRLVKYQTCLASNPEGRDCSWRSHKL